MCTCIHYFAALFCGKYFQLFTGFAQKIIFLIYLYFVCFSLAPYWPDRYGRRLVRGLIVCTRLITWKSRKVLKCF